MKHKTELSQIKEKDDSKRVSEKEVKMSYGIMEGLEKYLKTQNNESLLVCPAPSHGLLVIITVYMPSIHANSLE